MTIWARLGLFGKCAAGCAVGTVGVLLVVHLVQLYLSLLQIIQFVNTYGPKIQKLP